VLVENQHLFEIIRALEETQSYAEIVQVAEKMTESGEKYLLATNALLHLRQWHKLIQYCDAGLLLAEESEFHHLKGKALIKLGNFPNSIHSLRRAVFLNATIAAYRRNLAAAYYQLKRYE
jgi:Flp pilus assembly protein TadD